MIPHAAAQRKEEVSTRSWIRVRFPVRSSVFLLFSMSRFLFSPRSGSQKREVTFAAI